MPVRLVAVTKQSVVDLNSSQDLIAYCARVSNPANQLNTGTSSKLLEYMVKNKHWSPFEMAHMVLEIRTTRDIARQILRHKSFSFQEFSLRYSQVLDPPVFREARMQDLKNRQSSYNASEAFQHIWEEAQKTVWESANTAYEAALNLGIAKEVARAVLPEGMTPSRLYMAGSVRSWIHYVELRCGNGTQKEHQAIASDCKAILLDQFPVLSGVLGG